MKSSIHFTRGGGANSLKNTKSAFKPLIASSLALALGMSVAVATDPTISYNNDGGSNGVINPTPQDSWKWGATSGTTIGTDTGDFYQLQDNSSNGIKNLTLVFDKLTDPTNTPTQAVTEATSIKTLTITGNGQVSGNNAVFTISNSGSGKGILLGAGSADDERGMLTFNFLGSDGASKDANWNYTNDTHKRRIVLNLTDSTTLTTSNQKVSLVGDILIKAGKGIRNANDLTQARPNHQSVTNTNEFEAIFGEDMIGNISIKPSDIKDPDVLTIKGDGTYATNKQSGYRDIKSTFTFTAGSLNGDILSEAGENTFTFNGNNVKINGSITANNGYYDTSGTWGAGSENEYVGGVNIINFAHTGTITGDISANISGQNKITFSENGTILGKIISGKETSNDIRASSANHNNLIVFNGTSATIGDSSSTQASIILNNRDTSSGTGRGRYSNNTVAFNSTTNNVYLSKIMTKGEFGTGSSPSSSSINFNILSFNNSATTNTLVIDQITSDQGNTIIGKNLYANNSYNSNVFEKDAIYGGTTKYKSEALLIKGNFATEFLKTDYQASGNFTFGDITASYGGGNYINISGTTSITGNVVSEAHNSSYGNHNNTLVLSGTSATFGSKGKEISIIVDNDSPDGRDYKARSVNSIILNATTNTLHLNQLSAKGYYIYKSNNILSFNSNDTNTLNATAVVANSKGYNFIGKNLITQTSGYASALFDNPLDIKSDFATHFMTNTYTAKGTYTLGSVTATSGGNYINVENLTINKEVVSGNAIYSRSGNNYIYMNSGSILGNIYSFEGSTTIKSTTSLTLGALGAEINITADSEYDRSASNTIEANAITAYIGAIKAGGTDYGPYNNTISANSGTINIASLTTYTFVNSQAVRNIPINSITLKQGTLTIGSISTTGSCGRDNKNEFTLGASGDVTASVTGTTTTSGNGAKTIFNVSGSGSTLTFGGNISTSNSGVMNIALGSDTTAVTLQGAQSTITTLTAVSSATSGNSLTLDATNNSVTATIKTVANGENLNVIFNGQGANKEATLKLNNTSGTTLKNISIKSGATTENILEFSAGANSILGTFTIGSGQDLSINLSGANTSLNLVGGLSKGSGSAYINIANRANATLSGAGIDATKLSFAGTSALTINNSNASLGEIGIASGANATLKGEAVSATTLSFAGTSSLNIANEDATIAGISVASGNATLSGIALSGSTLTFADNTSLTLNNAGDSFALVDTSSASTNGATLTIGGNLNASIAQLQGNNLKVNFAKREQNGNAKLSILDSQATDKTITLKGVSVANDSTNNTLNLSNLTIVNIGSAVSLAKDTELTLNLKGTALAVTGGLTSINGGDTLTEATNGTLKISVDSGTSSLTATGGSLNITNLEMVGSGKTTLILKSNAEIGTLTAQASGGNVLEIDSSGAGLSVITHNLSGNLEVAYKGSNAGTLVINGGTHTLSSVGFDTSGGKGALTLNNTFTTIASEVSANGTNTLALTLRNSELELAGATNTLTSLDTQGSRIDLSGVDSRSRASVRNTLTVENYKQNSNSQFVLYADSKSADKVTFSATDGTKTDTSATISIIGQADLFNVTYKQGSGDNVELVDASQGTAKDNINIIGGQSIIGGILAQAELKQGEGVDEGKWFIGKIEDKGLSEPYQEIANTALTVNYDLFLANFNSLNKRMGELRDNPHSQGVWARVFGGAMSNDFGAGSKSEYVTAQAGYDYSLTLGNANNYMGIAIAYGKSWTKSNNVSTGGIANGVDTFSLDEVDSNMVEVGIYNSYVMDSGWYNDTIFKFDYIMSEFSLSNDPAKTSTNNFAMVLSDEFGYRYKFAESEKGSWYIDPQVEVAFGYFNQSDFNRMIYDKSNFGLDVEATQDAILNLRTRAGMSLGKKFNTAKGFATLYVGAFYEYDYIEGGNTTAGRVGGTVTQLDKLESNGRAIVNVGSNIELTEGVRMYIDVEKSFGDKQRVDMQFNFGARYSFGEKTPTPSYLESQKKKVAPLKVEDKQEATQESKTEASANTEVKQ